MLTHTLTHTHAHTASYTLMLTQDNRLETFFFKLRFWYEEVVPQPAAAALQPQPRVGSSSPPSRNSFRLFWMTEEFNSEYDIPLCAPGTPPSHCVHMIQAVFRAEQVG